MPLVRVDDVDLREVRPGIWIRIMIDERIGGRQITMVRGKVAPQATLPLHYHDFEEAFTVISGHGISEIDGVSTELSSGDALLIPAKAKHQLTNPSNTDDLVFVSCFPWPALVMHPASGSGD